MLKNVLLFLSFKIHPFFFSLLLIDRTTLSWLTYYLLIPLVSKRKARRVWSQYYTTSTLRDTLKPLEAFLEEATAALDAGMTPDDLGARLKQHMLDNSERLDYHCDGDLPMVLYRLWLRCGICRMTTYPGEREDERVGEQ